MGYASGAVLDGALPFGRPDYQSTEPIAFIDLKRQYERIGAEVSARIQDVVESGRYVMGPVVQELEERLADYCGVRHAISVSSGTDALFIALLARGIGPGDAVLMPGFTFTATAEVVVLAGATPVFVDVEPDTFNLCPLDFEAKIERVLAEGRLTPKAAIVVDLFGQPPDYTRLNAIARKHDLYVIGDAAQSFGARLENRRVGGLADVTATSFYPSKPLGCYGDGGALFTDDDDLAQVLRSVRSHGEGGARYDNVRIGVNGRLDAIQAAVLLTKLDLVLDDELETRAQVALAYDNALGGAVATPHRIPGVRSAWAQYTIKAADRDGLKAALADQSIPTMVYYPKPIHFQPAYEAYGDGPGSLPVSERLCEEVISLPFHPYIEQHHIERVSGAVRDYLAG